MGLIIGNFKIKPVLSYFWSLDQKYESMSLIISMILFIYFFFNFHLNTVLTKTYINKPADMWK